VGEGGTFRVGVRLGVDVGSVRIGVATCDPAGLIATPLETVRRGRGDLDRLADLVAERAAVEVVVGLPTTLAGRHGPAAAAAEAFATALAARLAAEPLDRTPPPAERTGPGEPGEPGDPGDSGGSVPVRLVDERLSTVGAQRDLRASGVDTRTGRSVVDQAAAVIILQTALDTERTSGTAPGRLVGAPAPGIRP
jgi:putative Holliday junction resolvase